MIKRGTGGRIVNNTLADSFWEKVQKTSDCWLWTGARVNGRYYGVINHRREGRTVRTLAHRASWLLHFGQIPAGICVLHKCDNVICVNPDHLFLGTQKDNCRDMWSKGRGKGGHPPGENHPRSKLKNFQRQEILRELARGISQYKLARYFGVSQATIWRVSTWRQS
jgi:hypothetical protein